MSKLDNDQLEVMKKFLSSLEQGIKDEDLKDKFIKALFEFYALATPGLKKDLVIQTATAVIVDYEKLYNDPYWKPDIISNIKYFLN